MTTEDENTLELVAQKLDKACTTLDRICHWLIGDGADPTKPGMMVRMDRLEQESKSHLRWRLLIVSTILGGGFTIAAAFISR